MTSASLPILELSGSPAERGQQHGEAARDQIHLALDFYAEAIGRSAGLNWDEVLARASNWLEPSRRFAPELVAEMQGIADAAGVDLLDILTLNARGEIIYDASFGDLASDPDWAGAPADGCTSFALLPEASGDGHVYCGQNWDWKAGVLGTVVLVRIVQPPAPTVIMQIEAGQVGRQGANSAGIALNANGLGGRFHNEAGVLQTLIRRKVLDADNLHTALEVLCRSRAHIASNALVTHRSGFAIDIETTPGAHGWMYPTNGLLVHGNHFQASVPAQLADSYRPISVDSLYRVPQAERGLQACRACDNSSQVQEAIRHAMSDHLGAPEAVCTHADTGLHRTDQQLTLVSSCVDLTSGEYRLTVGPPCESPYQVAPWNLYDGPNEGASYTDTTVPLEVC